MKILFDLSSTQPSGSEGIFHGGGEYAKIVFHKLIKALPYGSSLEIFYNSNRSIEEALIKKCNDNNIVINTCVSNNEISNLLNNNNYNVFYSALPYSYYNLKIPEITRFVYTIHGLRALEYPFDKYKLKYCRLNIKKSINFIINIFFNSLTGKYLSFLYINKLNKLFNLTNNQNIITISNHSRYSLLYFFGSKYFSSLKVLYSPLKENENFNYDNADVLNSFSLTANKYMLLICGHRSEKGAYRACRVLYKLIKKCRIFPEDIKIIFLGVNYKKSYLKLVKNNNRFIFHEYVSAADLEILYKNAYVFLFPTLNEGFGTPPLEAMKYGTVCACSANSSITEIYGDSVIYFNPYDEIEMSIKMLQCFDEKIRQELTHKMSVRFPQIRDRQEKDLDSLINCIISND